MTPPSGLRRHVPQRDRAEVPQRGGEAELEQLERDRGAERRHRLGRVADHHETVRRRGDDLLPRVRRPPALDEPSVRRHLVGAVDGEIEAVDRPERLHLDPELAGGGLPCGARWPRTGAVKPRLASAGSKNATVEPVPSPTVMPSSTSSAAASAAALFS